MSAPAKRHYPPAWRVEIREHRVERWTIAACVVVVAADDQAEARAVAIRWAHADAGAPPWRPTLRGSWPFSSAALDGLSVTARRLDAGRSPRRADRRRERQQVAA